MNSTMLTAHLHEITAGLEASLNNATLAQTITASLSASERSAYFTSMAMLQTTIEKEKVTIKSVDQFWTLLAAFLVFFMQAGFGMLEGGTVRRKNQQNILVKNVVDAAIGGIAFWSIGYAFAFGKDNGGGFLGGTDFFLASDASIQSSDNTPWVVDGFTHWIFQWAFAATASTIVSGAVAERTQFVGYLIYTFFITAFVYPVVVHWGWSPDGWLATRRFIDFAGSGIVHMVGGTAALVGAIVVGPRRGRFLAGTHGLCGGKHDPDTEREFVPASMMHCALGTLILWFGWYGFNAGSTTAIHDAYQTASLAAINTTLCPAAAVCTVVTYMMIRSRVDPEQRVDLGVILNCVLGGLVAITAGCANMRPWGAVLTGFVSVWVYLGSSSLLTRLGVDDVLDASPVHLFCGAWGVLAAGLWGEYEIGGSDMHSKRGDLIGIQLGGILAIFTWTAVCSLVIFGALRLAGILRVSEEDERTGLDVHHARMSRAQSVLGSPRSTIRSGAASPNKAKPMSGKESETVLGNLDADKLDLGKAGRPNPQQAVALRESGDVELTVKN